MELANFITIAKSRLGTILVIVAAFFVLGLGLTLIQPLKYSSNLSLLVVQQASGNSDPYTTSKSTEYLSDILSKVSYSSSFFNRVMASGLGVDAGYFGNTNKKIAQNWSKTIEVKPLSNTGIIAVTAYHPNRDQAEKIARAVGTVLITDNGNYHGLGDKVSLKLLDNPITSTYPVKPNLLLNAVLALALGLAFALAFVYLWPEFDLLASRKTVVQADETAFSQLNLMGEAEPIIIEPITDIAPEAEAMPFDPDFFKTAEDKSDWPKGW